MQRLLMIFATLLLAASPAAAATSAPTPDPLVEQFLGDLRRDGATKAYTGIWQGTVMEKKQAELATLIGQTDIVIQNWGKVIDWEQLSETTVGSSYIERIYLVRTTSIPLFFKFVFFKPGTAWTVNSIYFTDQYKNVQ